LRASHYRSSVADTISKGIEVLAYLIGQSSGDGMLNSCFIQIREDRFGQFRHTASHKWLGESGVFRQLFKGTCPANTMVYGSGQPGIDYSAALAA
jgi:hypothetical protein